MLMDRSPHGHWKSHRDFTHRLLLASIVGLGILIGAAGRTPVSADSVMGPLRYSGEATFYQRVLMLPDATLRSSPGGTVVRDLNVFDIHYVFGRSQHAGEDWVEVGRRSDREAEGSGGHSERTSRCA